MIEAMLTNGYGQMIEQQRAVTEIVTDLKTLLAPIAETFRQETLRRIQNIIELSVDYSLEVVCQQERDIHRHNHIAEHKDETTAKVARIVEAQHTRVMTLLNCFTYKGRRIGEYINLNDYNKDVEKCVLNELYNTMGEDNARTFNNIRLCYDYIRMETIKKLEQV